MNIIPAVILMISVLFSGSDYKSLLKEGDEYSRKFDNYNAVKKYEQAYSLAQDDFEVLCKLAKGYNDLGEELVNLKKNSEAEAIINKAVNTAEKLQKKYPGKGQTYTYLAWSYGNIAMFKGNKEKIKYTNKIGENGRKAIKMNPGDPIPYLIMGIFYRELAGLSWVERAFANTFLGHVPEGSYEDSEKMFKKALQINPNAITVMYNLSKTYRKMDRKNEETALLHKLLNTSNTDYRDKYSKAKAKQRLAEI
jgi:tetratricopeptide (TPR) repeat protein